MDNNERMGLLHEGIIFAETIGSAKCQMDTEDARFLYDLARRAGLAPQWLPIETAPKDGTQFIFNAPQMDCGLSIGEFIAGRLCSSFNGKVLGDWVTPPTHWMPLPAPPKGGE